MTSRYLNLSWFLPAMLIASCADSNPPLFVDVTELSGLSFSHQTRASGLALPPVLGSGVALFDVDNDGDLDVFLVQGAGLSSLPHELWLNESEDTELRFSRLESESNVGAAFDASVPGVGVAVEDVNLDGRLDVFVSGVGADRLLLNTEAGFVVSSAIDNAQDWSSSVVFVDINVDGLPDVFVTRVGVFEPDKECRSRTRQIDYCGAHEFAPLSDRLWINRGVVESGDVSFDDVSEIYGLNTISAPSLSARVADFDADGWPDIYVAAYARDNAVWMNQRGQRLEERALRMGGASSFVPEHRGSVGVDAADIDRDGDLDVVVTHHRGEPHQLYRNDGDGGFLASTLGAAAMTEADSGAGLAIFDANADSRADVYVANGALRRRQSQVDASDELPLRQRNVLVLQEEQPPVVEFPGESEPSDLTTAESPIPTGGRKQALLSFRRWVDSDERLTPRTRVSRAVAIGDLDNDGDLDLVVTNNDNTAEVFQNSTNPDQWLGLVPVSAATGLPVSGARVTLELPGVDRPNVEDSSSDAPVDPNQEVSVADALTVYGVREVRRESGYLASSDPRVLFYGPFAGAVGVRVTWPGGDEETFRVQADAQYHTLVRGTGQPRETP